MPVGRSEYAGGDHDIVEAAVRQNNLFQHVAHAGAVHDIHAHGDGGSAGGNARSRDSDACAVGGREARRSGLGCFRAEVGAHHVRALLRQSLGHGLADAAPSADRQHDVPRQLFFGGHAPQFGFLKLPILDVEGLLLW